MSIARRQSYPAGFTLAEMSVCLTVGAIIFGVTVELLTVAMRVDSAGGATDSGSISNSAANPAALDRLAEQFRADVHAASEILPPAADGARVPWALKMPGGGRIEYAAEDHVLARTEYSADQVKARDAFWLPPGMTVRWETNPAEKNAGKKRAGERTHVVSILLDQLDSQANLARPGEPRAPAPPSTEDTANNSLRIDAVLGADYKFAQPPAKK